MNSSIHFLIQNEHNATLPDLPFYGLGVLLLIPGPVVSVAHPAGQLLPVFLQLSKTSYTLEEEEQGKEGVDLKVQV